MRTLGSLRLGAFFDMLTEAEIHKLLWQAASENYRKGEVIFRKGDAGNGMYLVLAGYVAVSIDCAFGNDRPLRLYGPGDTLGDISLFDGKGRISGAIAFGKATLKFVDRSRFEEVLAARPGLARQVVDYLCARMRRQHDDLDAGLSLDVPARLARLLLSLHRRFSPLGDEEGIPSVRFSQADLAALLGFSRRWIGRELLKWHQMGIVELGRKQIVLRDVAALERIVIQGDSRRNKAFGRIRRSGRAPAVRAAAARRPASSSNSPGKRLPALSPRAGGSR